MSNISASADLSHFIKEQVIKEQVIVGTILLTVSVLSFPPNFNPQSLQVVGSNGR